MAKLAVLDILLVLSLGIPLPIVVAHEEPQTETKPMNPPIDSGLWAHIILMVLAMGLIFPSGMVLGIVRSVWHIPVQVLGVALALLGCILGYVHRKSSSRGPNVHTIFAKFLIAALVLQIALGSWTALQRKRVDKRVLLDKVGRTLFVSVHKWVGRIFPLMVWTQILFGVIAAMRFCHEDHLGQCLSHFIMGSSFIALGIFMLVILLVGQTRMRRTGKSQEFFESIVFAAWGCFNTFTEHKWGTPWIRNDVQHTSMGLLWWWGGLLGIWLSYPRGNHQPQRNVLPSFILMVTGWVFTSHPQDSVLSEKIHAVFGWTLVLAGLTRIVEVSFIVKSRIRSSIEVNSWQHLTPLLYLAAGFLFMGANEEQVQILALNNVNHGAYTLLLYSAAVMSYLYINLLLYPFTVQKPPKAKSDFSKENSIGQYEDHDGHRRWMGRNEGPVDNLELEALVEDDGSDV